MHEFSIARALIELADRHAPPNTKVRSLQVQVGPLQAIEEDAMGWAWAAATADTAYAGALLELEYLAPRRRCRTCGAESSGEPFDACPDCDSPFTLPIGGDELLLVSLDVEDHPTDGGGEKRHPDLREEPESRKGQVARARTQTEKETRNARPGRRECSETQ